MAGFAQDIKPMFREFDRTEMEWAFDLWDYEDVRENAAGILERMADGSMPCDGAWTEADIEKFRQWIAEGTPE